jgi:hypothetical protein
VGCSFFLVDGLFVDVWGGFRLRVFECDILIR